MIPSGMSYGSSKRLKRRFRATIARAASADGWATSTTALPFGSKAELRPATDGVFGANDLGGHCLQQDVPGIHIPPDFGPTRTTDNNRNGDCVATGNPTIPVGGGSRENPELDRVFSCACTATCADKSVGISGPLGHMRHGRPTKNHNSPIGASAGRIVFAATGRDASALIAGPSRLQIMPTGTSLLQPFGWFCFMNEFHARRT